MGNVSKTEKQLIIRDAVEEILKTLGVPFNESTMETPDRVARMLINETCRGLDQNDVHEVLADAKLFPAGNDPRPVTVKDIPFYSICEHHLVPFFGKAEVSYVPRDKVIGLSKIPRIVKILSAKPHIQENLTQEIAHCILEVTNARSVTVTLYDVRHLCVESRGVGVPCTTDTSVTLEGDLFSREETLCQK